MQLRELRALIGYFDLDPNRLADVALDGFASQPDNLAYLELMQLFPPDALPQILGFKFNSLAQVRADFRQPLMCWLLAGYSSAMIAP